MAAEHLSLVLIGTCHRIFLGAFVIRRLRTAMISKTRVR